MRKFYMRLFSVIVLSMVSLIVVAQAPVLTGLSPSDGACGVGTDPTFTLTFNQAVMPKKGGTISLNNSSGSEIIPIQIWWGGASVNEPPVANGDGDYVYTGVVNVSGTNVNWTVTFSGSTVSIHFGYNFPELGDFYVTVSETLIRNAANQFYAGLGINGAFPGYHGSTVYLAGLSGCPVCSGGSSNDPPEWDFTVGDFHDPYPALPAGLFPLDDAVGVSTSAAPTVNFGEPVYWAPMNGFAGCTTGTATHLMPGDIALYKQANDDDGEYGGDVVFIMPLSASISGNVLTIIWPSAMPPLTDLYIRIKPGLIMDGAGNPFAGFNTNGEGTAGVTPWNFTTKDSKGQGIRGNKN